MRQLNVDTGEHAGAQFVVFVLEARLHGHVTGRFADTGLDGGDFPFELLVGVGVQRYAYLQALLDAAQLLLGQGEVDENRLQLVQTHHRRAGLQELAQIHLANAEHAVEGRTHGFIVQLFALGLRLRHRLVALGAAVVQFGAGNRALLEQPLVAVVLLAGQAGGGFQRIELGAVGGGFQADQHVALLHRVTGFELDRFHFAGHLRGHVDAVHGVDGAHGFQNRRPVVLAGFVGGNGGGGLRHVVEEVVHHLAHERLEAKNKAEDDSQDDQHDHHALAEDALTH